MHDFKEIDDLNDAILAAKAKLGDHEAFNELVRRHRSKAFGVARRYAVDPHLAEDIVQEALLRAFLHVSSLTDPDRFVPWLQAIVRNQANTKLRRGGPFGKERPFTSFAPESNDNDLEWSDLDRLLYQLSMPSMQNGEASEPLEQLVRREVFDTMRQMVSTLKQHERDIFEAHFYRQMSPGEIAKLLSISTDQVYKTISRSRLKMKDARFRMYVQEYISDRKEAGQPEFYAAFHRHG